MLKWKLLLLIKKDKEGPLGKSEICVFKWWRAELHSNPKVDLVSWAPSLALHHYITTSLEVKLGVGSVLRQMCEQAVGRQDQMGSQHPGVSSLKALMDGEGSQKKLDMAEWWVGKESVRVQTLMLERLKHYPASSWDALLLHGYQQLYLTKFSPFLGCFTFEGVGGEEEVEKNRNL